MGRISASCDPSCISQSGRWTKPPPSLPPPLPWGRQLQAARQTAAPRGSGPGPARLAWPAVCTGAVKELCSVRPPTHIHNISWAHWSGTLPVANRRQRATISRSGFVGLIKKVGVCVCDCAREGEGEQEEKLCLLTDRCLNSNSKLVHVQLDFPRYYCGLGRWMGLKSRKTNKSDNVPSVTC